MNSFPNMRLDQYIVSRYGYSRNKSQQFIESGFVFVDANICNKSSYILSDWKIVTIKETEEREWVSRSAGKLIGFFRAIGVDRLVGKSCLDIGSSTGGFTQILLQYGASRVISVDVGTEQLHPSLREDSRVILHENTDIRTFSPWETYDIITIDVSFISLYEIIPVLSRFSHVGTQIYLLYKPQFEVWRSHLRKTGVPKSETIIQSTLDAFCSWLVSENYRVENLLPAQVIGEAGNQEYMLHIGKDI